VVADKYKRSPKDIMRDQVQDMRKASLNNQIKPAEKQNATLPRQQNESPTDWLKRLRSNKKEGG